jgi:K+/H+ antiporter YhaU regulatory subunit KhtT
MSLLENIKKTLKDGSEKVVKIAEDMTVKIKDVGEEGLELSKEALGVISERTSDVTTIARYKLELNEIQSKIESEMTILGELVFKMYLSKRKEKTEEKIQTQVKTIEKLKKDLQRKTNEYEDLRKKYSHNYVIQKFSDELAASEVIIEQVLVSDKSISINKALKDLVLPKQALISAIKRNTQVIIPDGNTKILIDDQVTIIGNKDDVEKVKKILSISPK